MGQHIMVRGSYGLKLTEGIYLHLILYFVYTILLFFNVETREENIDMQFWHRRHLRVL